VERPTAQRVEDDSTRTLVQNHRSVHAGVETSDESGRIPSSGACRQVLPLREGPATLQDSVPGIIWLASREYT